MGDGVVWLMPENQWLREREEEGEGEGESLSLRQKNISIPSKHRTEKSSDRYFTVYRYRVLCTNYYWVWI